MNQRDQMREAAWQKAVLSNTPQNKLAFDDGFNAGMKAQQALAHVNETPKNEHDSDDVLKRSPLVRLTDDDFEKVYLRFVGLEGFSPRFAQQFANAIMDAMERVNK